MLPLTYLIRLVRGAIVFDRPIWDYPTAIGVIAAWGLLGLVLAVLYFRWEPSQHG